MCAICNVSNIGIRRGLQVPFGKVVSCPTCRTALAVVQPQQGVQVFLKSFICGSGCSEVGIILWRTCSLHVNSDRKSTCEEHSILKEPLEHPWNY